MIVTRTSGLLLANEPCTAWRFQITTSPGAHTSGTASGSLSEPAASAQQGFFPANEATEPPGLKFGLNGRALYYIANGIVKRDLIDDFGLPVSEPFTARSFVIQTTGMLACIGPQALPAVVKTMSLSTIDGSLTELGSVRTLEGVARLAIDPRGRFFCAFAPGMARIGTYRLDSASGTPIASGTAYLPSAVTAATVDFSGRFLYLTSATSNAIYLMEIDQRTGTPSLAATRATGGNPCEVVVSENIR